MTTEFTCKLIVTRIEILYSTAYENESSFMYLNIFKNLEASNILLDPSVPISEINNVVIFHQSADSDDSDDETAPVIRRPKPVSVCVVCALPLRTNSNGTSCIHSVQNNYFTLLGHNDQPM